LCGTFVANLIYTLSVQLVESEKVSDASDTSGYNRGRSRDDRPIRPGIGND